MPALPPDYLERVYAGVLGKIIGVYLGRPFEGWTHQRILEELGHIKYYVHDRLNHPLVVTDDDVSGTFGFVRALEEHGVSADLSSEAIGKTWLNNVVERRSVFWWGGKGISTEHTAFINLRNGIPAPLSGSIETNGQTVAEQIGAQIFIDGWALVAPTNPALAAKLAAAAGSVSHDGESVHAAKLWAAMEAEAFVSKDVDHLLDTGLQFVPKDSRIARLISDVRGWVKQDADWLKTRQRIEDIYGYDKFHGCCHVMPNHGIMVMALLYGGGNFHEAMHIINTCGWDTDCNSGNVGCLVALMHGLSAFEGGPDWRGPVADRALISTADGGYSINNAARISIDIANLGRKLAGQPPVDPPKDGAQFHFTLPGSVQGFQADASPVKVEQGVDGEGRPGLAIRLANPPAEGVQAEVLTQVFTPKEVLNMLPVYPLMASPLVYPGQKVRAVVRADSKAAPTAPVKCNLRLKAYGKDDELVTVDGPGVQLPSGKAETLEWTIPDTLDSQPIQQLGVVVSSAYPAGGTVWLDSLGWSGVPNTVLRRPSTRPCDFWTRAWVNAADDFHKFMTHSFCVAKNNGEGIVSTGTRDWTDYKAVVSKFKVTIGDFAGVAVRVQGLNRYYALVLKKDKTGARRAVLVKARDEQRVELASVDFDWKLDDAYEVTVVVQGARIQGAIGGKTVEATDSGEKAFSGGGVGFVVADGSLSADSIAVSPP